MVYYGVYAVGNDTSSKCSPYTFKYINLKCFASFLNFGKVIHLQ